MAKESFENLGFNGEAPVATESNNSNAENSSVPGGVTGTHVKLKKPFRWPWQSAD